MKSLITFIWISILLCFQAFSQWTWRNPLPQGQALECAWFFNADTGILAGEAGTIMKTIDGGISWSIQLEGAFERSSSWENIWFTDSDTGYMIDRGRCIFKTLDGGQTWNLVYNENQGEDLLSLTFIDNLHGLVTGSGGLLLETTNGGSYWNRRTLYPQGYLISICFSDPQNGYIANYSGSIFHSSDAGLTWDLKNSGTSSLLRGIHFVSANEGFAYGYDGVLLKTIDGGETWVLHQNPDSLMYFAMDSFNQDTLLLLGSEMITHGHIMIFQSQDGGDSWSVVKQFSQDPAPISIFCLNNGTVYAVGARGAVYKSTDWGISWISLTEWVTLNSISCIDFPSEEVGYASMKSDEFWEEITVLKTIDGGDSWFPLDTVFEDEVFFSVEFPTEEIGYIGGVNIYRTTDGGINWTRRYTSSWDKVITSISFPIPSMGVAVGDNGLILLTDNLGFSWTTVESGTEYPLTSVCMTDIDTGYIAGHGIILKTTDGGTSWVFTEMPYNFNEIHFTNPSTGYVVADLHVFKTINGGETWDEITPFGLEVPIYHVHFYDSDTGYIAGGTYIISGIIYKTTDAGEHWTEEEVPTDYPIECIYVTKANKVFAGGWPGFIFGKSNSLVNGITLPANSETEFTIDCFPNPFHSSTTIKFQTDNKTNVKLVIYDLSGKEIKRIVDTQKEAGTHELSFDGSVLEAGIYFYGLSINNLRFTGKLVLLK